MLFAVFLNKKGVSIHKTETPLRNIEIVKDGEYCFKKSENKDLTEITLKIQDEKVSGTMNWIPFEKDSARGTLEGKILSNGEMSLIYYYIIEGSYQTEEKIMKIENGKLLIKHGELLDPKYDGNLIYKNKETATYSESIDSCTENK